MDQSLFIQVMEDALSAPAGSIRGSDKFESIEGWDSVGVLSVIALLDERFGAHLGIGELSTCQTVSDLHCVVAAQLASRKAAA